MKRIVAALWFALLASAPGLGKAAPDEYARLREEAFIAAQSEIVSAAADALGNAQQHFSESDGPLAAALRQQNGLDAEISTLRSRIDALYGQSSAAAKAETATLNEQLAAKRRERTAIIEQIETQFPAYAELMWPKPLASAAVRAILNSDEAMLLIVPGKHATYVFALTAETFDWARVDLPGANIHAIVKQLRNGLAPSGKTGSHSFSRSTAYFLYANLIAPLESQFRGKKVLYTLTTGALQSLPLNVLVTEPPAGFDAGTESFEKTHWLIDRYAMTTLPTVSSLMTLRCIAPKPGGTLHSGCIHVSQRPPQPQTKIAFAGIGDPSLRGQARADITFRDAGYGDYMRGAVADPEKLAALPSLPGTADELASLERGFHGRGTVLLLKGNATETEVKRNRALRDARVVVFATHALIAGETGARGEPGLVLTPPASPTVQDDGLLTASEIATLHLSAEFVVLSACNTARTNDKLDADGLSGLARAFFYAGARSMLVSNWQISDAATPELMNQFFKALAASPADGRAVALQKAIQQMKTTPQWSDPRYWGAFVLVGETSVD